MTNTVNHVFRCFPNGAVPTPLSKGVYKIKHCKKCANNFRANNNLTAKTNYSFVF